MERVRIDELKVRYREKHGTKPTNEQIGEYVFDGDIARPVQGQRRRRQISDDRKAQLIARLNNGHDLTALKPRHILRLGEFFEVTQLTEVLEA